MNPFQNTARFPKARFGKTYRADSGIRARKNLFRPHPQRRRDFRETFHDNGPADMYRTMKCYYKAGFDVPLRSDHIPTMAGESNESVGYRWTNDKKLGFDSHHANEAGCYLGALVWYGFLFGESPNSLSFVPKEVSADFASHLKKVADEVVLE